MPLFGNKFSPKKTAARKWPSLSSLNLDSTTQNKEFGLDPGPIKIKLGGNEVVFDNGQWIAGIHIHLIFSLRMMLSNTKSFYWI